MSSSARRARRSASRNGERARRRESDDATSREVLAGARAQRWSSGADCCALLGHAPGASRVANDERVATTARGRKRRSSSRSGTARCFRCSGTIATRASTVLISEHRDGEIIARIARVAGLSHRARLDVARRGARAARTRARAARRARGRDHARWSARAGAVVRAGRAGRRAAHRVRRSFAVAVARERVRGAEELGSVHDPEAVRARARSRTARPTIVEATTRATPRTRRPRSRRR